MFGGCAGLSDYQQLWHLSLYKTEIIMKHHNTVTLKHLIAMENIVFWLVWVCMLLSYNNPHTCP